MKKSIGLFTAMLMFFSACKKSQQDIDTCSNGYVDPGEMGVDCGGICSPCIENIPPYVYVECNGKPIVMSHKELLFENGYWVLNASNDTCSIQLNLGNNGAVAVHPLPNTGAFLVLNDNYYMNSSDGTVAFYYHDTVSNKMGGFFQSKFWRDGFDDTLWIQSGQFENMFY